MNAQQYKRIQRAKKYQCTKCGGELESRNFMMCVACRQRARQYMQKKRSNISEAVENHQNDVIKSQ